MAVLAFLLASYARRTGSTATPALRRRGCRGLGGTLHLLADEAQHPLGERLAVEAVVQPDARVVRLAALEALVDLLAHAERALHHIGRHRQHPQVVACGRGAAAEEPLDVRPDR